MKVKNVHCQLMQMILIATRLDDRSDAFIIRVPLNISSLEEMNKTTQSVPDTHELSPRGTLFHFNSVQFLCETGLLFMEMKAAQPTALASEYTTREGNICFLQIGLRFKLCICSRQNLSSTRTSESKTTCASQPFLHSVNRCRALVMSLQTSPMIKKLEIIEQVS